METPDHIQQFKLLGGNPVLDFLNTGGGPPHWPAQREELHDYQDLVAWSLLVGTLTEPEAGRLMRRGHAAADEAQATHERTVAQRRYLSDLFADVAAGRPPSASSLALLRDDAAEALGHAHLTIAEPGLAWSWPRATDLARPLWSLAHDALTLLTIGPVDRIKRCPGCGWWFIDQSKNQSRRWCSMDDCGTGEKIRRFVARRAANRSDQSRAVS